MIKYSDAYIETVSRAHLDQDEAILAKAGGVHRPWYTGGFLWFWKSCLVVATNKRLLVAEHRRGLFYDRLEAVHSIPWSDLGNVKVAGLFMKKTLKIEWAGKKLALRLPRLLAPTPKNIVNAKHIETTYKRALELATSAPLASLPATTQQPVFSQPPAAAPQMQAQQPMFATPPVTGQLPQVDPQQQLQQPGFTHQPAGPQHHYQA